MNWAAFLIPIRDVPKSSGYHVSLLSRPLTNKSGGYDCEPFRSVLAIISFSISFVPS